MTFGEIPVGTGKIQQVLCEGEEWRVHYRATYWKGITEGATYSLQPGDSVSVVGRVGLKLIIRPISSEASLNT
mgnify:CR=1 FL=1